MTNHLLCHQLPIGEVSSVDDTLHGVTEYMRIFPIVESPLQFLKVTVQVFPAHLVEGSDNGTLEQAPDALDAVGMNITYNPLLRGMADGPVYRVVILNPHVGLEFIGVNGLSLILDGSTNEIVKGPPPDIRDALDSDLSAVPLDGSGDPGFSFLTSRSDIAPLSAYHCFIHFHDTEEGGSNKGIVAHRLSDAVTQIPSRSVSHSKSPVKLVGRDTFLGFAHKVNCQEPLSKGKVGIMHDSSRSDREFIPAILAPPLMLSSFGHPQTSAPGASYPIGPPQFFQGVGTGFIAAETINNGDQIHESNL